jgi:hypothetical protein
MEPTQRKAMSSGKSSRVDEEVARLLSKPVAQDEFLRLRNKYANDQELVDQVQAAYMESYANIEKRAKVFAQAIQEKYGLTNEPFSNLLLKALKYKQKYGLTDAEFEAFKRIYEQELVGAKRPDVPRVTTNVGKVLGDITLDTRGFGMKVSDADYRDLQEILKMYEDTRPIHSQVIVQSLSYQDCGPQALNSHFKPELGHTLANHVHPVVAALFLPKIQYLEEYFLYSNMANVVRARYNGEPFTTRPDYELFYNLVSDPNDIVCDSRSPVKDLKNRVSLQKHLWNAVLALRSSNHFATNQLDFIRAVDMCRLNKYDTPDLVYGRYDGTIFKRLLSAFSFRPTIVATVPTPTVVSSNNPYFQSQTPQVAQISMINLRVGGQLLSSAPTVELKEALQQVQLFFENGLLVTKHTDVIYSRGIISFFVDRRATVVRIGAMQHPFNLGRLPVAASGFERLNTASVSFNNTIALRNDHYNLRSIVVAETTKVGSDSDDSEIIVGSSTYVLDHKGQPAVPPTEAFKYDPMSATNYNAPIKGAAPGQLMSVHKCTVEEAKNEARTKGIIFIYQSPKDGVEREGIKLGPF